MKVLVTGAAGFIGFHLSRRLLARGDEVIGLDNLNAYYDVRLKEARLALLLAGEREDRVLPSPALPADGERPAQSADGRFRFYRMDLADRDGVARLFAAERPQRVVNLAAQAGVRYSLQNPHAYVESNLVGFANVLEACRHHEVEHLVYASSSSVYGANTVTPFSVHHNVDHPVSLYAATKKANELMAHTYSHLFGIPTTGLRFFTVYGPWGRPDMALFLFTKAILAGEPIRVFNYGRMKRDFTYIDDIVEGVVRVIDRVPEPNAEWSGAAPDPATSSAPYRLYNIGNNKPEDLMRFIAVLEEALGRKATLELVPMQPGDVPETCADVDDLMRDTGFRPNTPIETGIPRFVEWYRGFCS